jgi:surfeit locus 1 family protein
MIARLRAAGLIWPTVMTLVALPILLALGSWQVQRKAWKEDLIARVKLAAAEAPVPFADVLEPDRGGAVEFRRVKLTGRFLHEREFHVWAPGPAGPQWSIVTPLELSSPIGADRRYPTQLVLVIRGVVDEARKEPSTRAAGQPFEPVEIVGRTRLGSSSLFAAKADVARNQWFAYDLNLMRSILVASAVEGSASGTAEKAMSLVAPVLVEAETAQGPPPAPQPKLDALNLSNRHLSYALTWYGLALTLIGVYLSFARVRWRALNED